MLLDKGINKISELKNGFTPKWLEPDFILSSLKCFSFSSLCSSLQPVKTKGYSFQVIFAILMALPFLCCKSIHSLLNSPMQWHIQAKKDTFYRLKNNPEVDWRGILWLFVQKSCKAVQEKGAVDNGWPRCLVVDDSLLAKTGKFIEKVSRVWDHVSKRYIIGYKLLALAYWDGCSCMAVDFSLHREKGKNSEKPYGLKKKELKKQANKNRQKGQPGYARAKEADISKIDIAVNMVKRAFSQGLQVDYLLMDSWFTCWAFIELVKAKKGQAVHLIGMYKIAKTKFGIEGQELTYSQVNNKLGKAKRCRKLGLYYKEAKVELKGAALKLFFSRQGTNGKWKVFLTTDTSLSFIKMIEIYQIRWTIEVFFKEAKQLLQLGKCQSNDFDAQIAETTITMVQHLMLTLRYRFDKYETKGALFEHIKEDIIQHRLNERLWGLFIELLQLIEELFDGIDGNEIIQKIFRDDKAYEKLNRILQLE
jgi:predicted nucleic acid-binding Zn finger protein